MASPKTSTEPLKASNNTPASSSKKQTGMEQYLQLKIEPPVATGRQQDSSKNLDNPQQSRTPSVTGERRNKRDKVVDFATDTLESANDSAATPLTTATASSKQQDQKTGVQPSTPLATSKAPSQEWQTVEKKGGGKKASLASTSGKNSSSSSVSSKKSATPLSSGKQKSKSQTARSQHRVAAAAAAAEKNVAIARWIKRLQRHNNFLRCMQFSSRRRGEQTRSKMGFAQKRNKLPHRLLR
jgi:hypothetical protein